jgi:glyoxylase-like metal-dependent hydrolase (beta-lactamase superfamily II)
MIMKQVFRYFTIGFLATTAVWLSQLPVQAQQPEATASAPASTVVNAIGRYTYPGPGTVNTWWIETPTSVIVIDVQRDLGHAREALSAVQRIGKPVSAILVTHGHPDHYAGIGVFKAAYPGLVTYASVTTTETIVKDGYGFNAFLQQATPDNFPNPVIAPDRLIAPDATLTIDGVDIVTHEFGPSDANSMTVYYLPATGDLFSGDIILSGMHAFFYEGASAAWLTSLDRLASDFPRAVRLHPGHGEPGAPAQLIAEQRATIKAARAIATDAIARLGNTPAAQAATNAELIRRFPALGNPVGMPNFLDFSTAGLFRELSTPATPKG